MPAWWLVVYTWDVLNGKIAPFCLLLYIAVCFAFSKIASDCVYTIVEYVKSQWRILFSFPRIPFLLLLYSTHILYVISFIWEMWFIAYVYNTCRKWRDKSKTMKKAMAPCEQKFLSFHSALSSLISVFYSTLLLWWMSFALVAEVYWLWLFYARSLRVVIPGKRVVDF